MTRIYVQLPEEQYNPYGMPKLLTAFKLAIYARQSTKDQVLNNKEAYEQQTVRLVENGIKLGWLQDHIVVFIENKRSDGTWRKASGSLRIDQRPGLQALVDKIEADEVKAVMVWAVDRLFRDEDMVEPATFAKICKKHNTIILTVDDYFDFNNKIRDDRRRFLEIAQAAADYVTKHVKGRMLPARAQVATRGEYDGRMVATGFILIEGEKKPREHLPHAEVIRYLFKRFRELDAQFNLLWREVSGKDLFPPYPKGMDIIGVKKSKFEAPFGLTYGGLKALLTNPVYIGWWYFQPKDKSTILIKNNHSAIVDEDDFWYAFNHLSKTTITGEPIGENIKTPTRFTRVGTIPAPSLLDGIITSPGYHVYVFQKADRPSSAAYAITRSDNAIDYYRVSIDMGELDRIFEQRMLYRLRYFQAIEMLQDKLDPNASRETSLYQHLKAIQETVTLSNAGVDSQIEEYRTEATNLDRVLRLGADTLDDATIKKYTLRLGRLNTTLAQLEGKKDEARRAEKDLKDAASLILSANEMYEKLPLERKRRLIRLVTTMIELTEPTKKWLRLEIRWAPFMGFTVNDIAFIWRPKAGTGDLWTQEQRALLKSMYETSDRDSILKAFPNRNWRAIRDQGDKLGLRRRYQANNSPISEYVSYNDVQFMQEMGLEYSESQPQRRVWWKTVTQKNDTGFSSRAGPHRGHL